MIFLKIAGLEKRIIGQWKQFLHSYSSCTDSYYSYSCLVSKIVEHCFDEMKEKLRAEDRGEMKFQEIWPEEMHKMEEERDEEHIEVLKSQKDEDQSIKKQQSGKKEMRLKKMEGIDRAERQIFTLRQHA